MKYKYKCGHDSEIIILDSNPLSISANLEWAKTVGRDGTRELCWDCWCKNRRENQQTKMKYTITDDQIQYIRDELEEVKNKQGPFKIDKDEFAWSVMEASTTHAENVLNLLDTIEKQHKDIKS